MEGMIMLKKFAIWFVVFGLSFLVSDVFHWTEQGKAFLYIHLSIGIIILLGVAVILVIGGLFTREVAMTSAVSFLLVFMTAGILAITLFATWGATRLFGVDFFVAYQIMTFGQCLCSENKNKNDD